jgi:hypothetical protein
MSGMVVVRIRRALRVLVVRDALSLQQGVVIVVVVVVIAIAIAAVVLFGLRIDERLIATCNRRRPGGEVSVRFGTILFHD